MPQTRRIGLVLVVLTWLISAFVVLRHRNDVFYDVDEGMLGESAERVMQGELPHRDFVDVYTGGLAELDAVGFRIWGVSIRTLRTVLVIATLLWVPVVFWVAHRLARPGPSAPWTASLVTLTAVCWSVPNHPRGMPTWYTLFLATAGTAAVLRYVDTRHRRWMWVAGVAAGLGCTIKIVGLYFIAAVLLFAVFDEQESDVVAGPPSRLSWYSVLLDGALVAFCAAIAKMVAGEGVTGLVHYVLPNAAIALLLIWREHTEAHAPPAVRVTRFLQAVAPFAVGVMVPVAVFLVPYVRTGALVALARGVFVTPFRRIGHLELAPPPPITLLAALPILAALGLIGRRWGTRALISVASVAVLAVWAWHAPFTDETIHTHWQEFYRLLPRDVERGLIPLSVIIGAIALAQGRTRTPPLALALVLCVLATGTLVQFPFSLPQYFQYVAPLVILAVFALAPRPGAAVVAAGFLLFAIVRLEPTLGGRDIYDTAQLDLPRGGPKVAPNINARYRQLRTLVRAHAQGDYIYAGPNSPQVYFFTGFRNPTPTLYEFFDDTAGRNARVLHAIDARHVTAVVINNKVDSTSGPIDPLLRQALDDRFPLAQTVDNYEVRWR
jgi:hypothetical protein